MKFRRLIAIATLALAFAGCQKQDPDEPQTLPQFTLGGVSDVVMSRATPTTTTPLALGYRFRLYIMPSGGTDITKLVATRTYTITGTAGNPSLDAGQDPIKLALDDYDFYVVGPLKGVNEAGVMVDIATEDGVNVYAGNDIVSSITKATVGSGNNVVTPNPLSHRMAKAEFIMQRPADAVYTDLMVEEITLDKQPVTGTFAFGADGGSITPSTTLKTRTYIPADATVTFGLNKYVTVDYLFAQPSKELKITTVFNATAESQGTPTEKKYEQSALITTAIAVGEFHRFTAEPIIPIELLWRLKLTPWYDQDQGSTSTEGMELVCSFSGLDEPITINGKQYWPDRSGNGNHGELVGTATHNNDGKYYTTTTNTDSYIQLPALGAMTNITLEIVSSTLHGGNTTPFYAQALNGDYQCKVHTPYALGNLYIDWGDATNDRLGPYAYMANDFAFYSGIATWQYTRTVGASNISSTINRNGIQLTSGTKRLRTLDFANARLLDGGGSVTKLYSMRLYRRVLTAAELVNNATNNSAVYAKAPVNDTGKYVQAGLILDLQGTTAPSKTIIVNQTVWEDQSLQKNHARNTSATATYPKYDAVRLGYQFNGSGSKTIMQLIKGLGDLSDCTIEIIISHRSSGNYSNLFFMDKNNNNMYYFKSTSNKYESTFPGVSFKMSDAPKYDMGSNILCSWTTVRNTKTQSITMYQNALQQVASNASQQKTVSIPVSTLTLDPVTRVMIGGNPDPGGDSKFDLTFDGYIHAIRIYNRALSDNERHVNYELDKLKYNILN